MSAKFAPITANLLARKGEAAATTFPPALTAPYGRPVSRPADRPADSRQPTPEWKTAPGTAIPALPAPETPAAPQSGGLDGEKPHKMVVTLTAGEHEALGIVSIKKGLSRPQIVRDALDAYFARLLAEYAACSCVGTGLSSRPKSGEAA